VLVLAGLLAMVLAMAFEPLAGNSRAVSGILWVLVVFTALHGLARSFDADFRDDALKGLLLTGADPAGVYLGKVASTAALLLAVALAAVAGIAVLFTTPSLLQVLPVLVGVIALAVVGLAALGATVTVLAHHSQLGETLLPLLLLPLAVPVLLAGVESAAALLEAGVVDSGWLRVLIFYAVGMIAASMMTFEYAVEG
jgi:heme exporter protein B